MIDGPAGADARLEPGITEQPDDHLDSLAGAIAETPERIGRAVVCSPMAGNRPRRGGRIGAHQRACTKSSWRADDGGPRFTREAPMSVNAETPIASSTANGVTTSFPYAFTVLSAADLVVQGVLSGITTVYTYGVHYTLTGLGTDAGSVEFLSPPANGTVITRYRSSELKRTTDYQDNGDLLAETLNRISTACGSRWNWRRARAMARRAAPSNWRRCWQRRRGPHGSGILNAAGAVERTLQSKLRDTVSVLDWRRRRRHRRRHGGAASCAQLRQTAGLRQRYVQAHGACGHGDRSRLLGWQGARLNYVGTAGEHWRRHPDRTGDDHRELAHRRHHLRRRRPQLYIWPGISATRSMPTSAASTMRWCAGAASPQLPTPATTRTSLSPSVRMRSWKSAFQNWRRTTESMCRTARTRITNNVVRNCGGIGIAAGYHSIFANFGGRNVTISGNIVFNDESADTALNYISGIDVVFCQTYVIKNNVVANLMPRDSRSVNNCIRTAYVTEEYTLYDGDISGNIAYRPLNRFVTVGEIGNAEIRRRRSAGISSRPSSLRYRDPPGVGGD